MPRLQPLVRSDAAFRSRVSFGRVGRYTASYAIAAVLAAVSAGCAGRSIENVTGDVPVAAPLRAEPEARVSTRRRAAIKNVEATAEYHFSLAQAFAADGNSDRAIEEYKLALLYDAKSPLIFARLAGEYVKKGMLSAALEASREAVRLDPAFTDARLMLAGLYSSTRETGKALAEYDAILKSDPRHEEAVVYRAILLVEDSKVSAAEASLKAFVARKKDAALVWYHLGRVQQQAGKVGEAATSFRRAMEARPGFTQAGLALGILYEEANRNREATRVYSDLWTEYQDPASANRLATILLKEEQYERALPLLEALAQDDPEDMNARVKLGLVRMQMKRYPEAIQAFQDILSKYPDSDRVLFYLGSIYEEINDPEAAIASLKKITPESKMFSDAVLHVAFLLKKQGRVEEARLFVRDSANQSPRVAGFYLFQASLEEEAKRIPEAIAIMERASELFPEDEKVRYYLGSLYERGGDTSKGLAQMEEILKINPDNVDALNYIGYTWTLQGVRLDDAERLLKRAMTLRPNNGFIMDSWGWYLYVRGRTKEAIVQLEKAARLKPDESTIVEHLADAYAKYNLREKALQQYFEAYRLTDDEQSRQKLGSKVRNLHRELGLGEPNLSGQAPTRAPASVPSSPER